MCLNELADASDSEREIKAILDEEVRTGRVYPAEMKTLAETFSDNPDALKALVNSRPPAMFAKFREVGSGGVGLEEPELQRVRAQFDKGDPVDDESARLHIAAIAILREKGKDPGYTRDEYLAACEQAQSALAYS